MTVIAKCPKCGNDWHTGSASGSCGGTPTPAPAATERKMKMRETMWATMEPDVYSGPSCDQVEPRWHTHCEGDRDSGYETQVEMLASLFPPGTTITVEEPLCPQCDELRAPALGGGFTGPCRCGFDWDTWVQEQFS